MKLSSSTGDFKFYVPSFFDRIACFKDTKFRYINLEQAATCAELSSQNDDDLKRFAESCREAAADANVTYVLSHAPCLHKPVLAALTDRDNEEYRETVRIIRRSIEVCHMLGIPRIVVHACPHPSFDQATFYQYNTAFYRDLLDLAEAYGITIMTENWDNDGSLLSTGKQLRDFVDSIDHPLLAICWDTAHGNISPNARAIGQYQNILAVGDKLKGLHIADNFGDCHHHTWPFAGIVNFDSVMQGLLDVNYDGYFNFEASYTLLHNQNMPHHRKPWEHQGKQVTTLLDPSVALKKKAVDLMYDIGQYLLESYRCFEEK